MIKKVTVVIPAYNSHATIGRLMNSIAMQIAKEDITVIVVDDCSSAGYASELARFSDTFDIKEVRLDENGGPGVARQKGLEMVETPYVTFIDADDTFCNAYSLAILLKIMEQHQNAALVAGSFVEESENMDFNVHENDMVWVFGKMYRKSFLDRYGIKFNDTRANEDNGFNTTIRLLSSDAEPMVFTSDIVYCWHFKADSITRVNNAQYSYDQSFVGYAYNMEYAIMEARKHRPFSETTMSFAVEVMCHLYEYYIEAINRDPRFNEQNLQSCKRFYKNVYAEIEQKLPSNALAAEYNKVMANAYIGGKLFGIVPELSFTEFIKLLKGR